MTFSLDGIINSLVWQVKAPAGGELIQSDLFQVENPKGLFVLIPPWRGRFDYFFLVRRKILKAGYSCLEYKFSSEILSSDYEKTRESFEEVRAVVIKDLEKINDDRKFKEINILGTSIGCVGALMIANHNPLIHKVVLVAPGNCLAESMWNGIRTQSLRKTFEQNSITLGFLKQQWSALAPENNIDGLTDKEIYIYLSKSDKVIPYNLGKRLVDSLKQVGNNPVVKENAWLGHYGTVLNFYVNPVLPIVQ